MKIGIISNYLGAISLKNALNKTDSKSETTFYENLQIAKRHFDVAEQYENNLSVSKTNSLVVDTLLFGIKTSNYFEYEIDQNELLNILPGILKEIQKNVKYTTESSYTTSSESHSGSGQTSERTISRHTYTTIKHHINEINLMVLKKLLVLKKANIVQRLNQDYNQQTSKAIAAPVTAAAVEVKESSKAAESLTETTKPLTHKKTCELPPEEEALFRAPAGEFFGSKKKGHSRK
jgi:hypothetical protein